MPFGLTNAPASFQHLMNHHFSDMVDKFVICYLDDILIYSDSLEEHDKHVTAVLQRLRKAGLYAKAEKCEFHLERVEFLGFVVGRDGLEMDQGKVQTILDWPTPRTVEETQESAQGTSLAKKGDTVTILPHPPPPCRTSPLSQSSSSLVLVLAATTVILWLRTPGRGFVVYISSHPVAYGGCG
jgi:hypothetical protein